MHCSPCLPADIRVSSTDPTADLFDDSCPVCEGRGSVVDATTGEVLVLPRCPQCGCDHHLVWSGGQTDEPA